MFSPVALFLACSTVGGAFAMAYGVSGGLDNYLNRNPINLKKYIPNIVTKNKHMSAIIVGGLSLSFTAGVLNHWEKELEEEKRKKYPNYKF